MAQAPIIAKVSSLTGEAYARNAEGKLRRLKAGDEIREGESVVTADGARVVLQLADGRQLTVLPGDVVRVDAEVAAEFKPDATDSAVVNDPKNFRDITKALTQGEDLDALLEAPAAGIAGPGGEGHTFVEFARIVESVGSQSYQFPGAMASAGEIFDPAVVDDGTAADVANAGTGAGGAVTITVSLQPQGLTADSTPTITGTTNAPAGSQVIVVIVDSSGNSQTMITTVQPGGSFSVTPLTPLTDGPFDVTADVRDPAGNSGTDTTTGEIDASAGSITVEATVDNAAQQVDVTGTTNDVPAGATVSITITDQNGATVTTTATVQPDGSYSVDNVDVSTLADGPLTTTATATDNNGNPVTDTDNDVLDSTAGAITVEAVVDNGNQQVDITGTTNDVPAGSTVSITITDQNGTTVTTTATVQPDGSYSVDNVDVSTLADGPLTTTATASDNNGNPLTDTDNDILDTTAPSAPTVTITEDINDDGVISTSELSGDIDVQIALPADAVAGDTLSVSNGTITQTFVLSPADVASGLVNTTFPSPGEGNTLTVTAQLTDQLGNVGPDGSDSALVDAVPPTISGIEPGTLGAGDDAVNEGETLVFNVSLSAAPSEAVSYALSLGGTATPGADYNAMLTNASFTNGVTYNSVTGQITVPAGVTDFAVSIPTLTDTVSGEPLETVELTIGGQTGIGGIIDVNAAPTLSVSNITVTEGSDSYAVFTVSLGNERAVATTVGLSLVAVTAQGGGVDFGSATPANLQVSTDNGNTWSNASSVIIAAGTTSVIVRTPIINDALDENNETFSLLATTTGGVTSNASATGTGTVIDNDPAPSLGIGDVTVNEGSGTVTFMVTLSAVSGLPVSVSYATSNGTAVAGSDFVSTSGTLVIPAGQTTGTITVSLFNDTIFEATESFNLDLSAALNATIADNQGVATIIDNDKVQAGGNVTGTEDTALVLTWANFGVTNEQVADAGFSIRIDSLPVDGSLQYFNGSTWTPVAANTTFTFADIDGGKLQFVPAAQESGIDGFASAGTGNLLNDYASLQFSVIHGGAVVSDPSVLRIDITPVADAPVLSLPTTNFSISTNLQEVAAGQILATALNGGIWRTDNPGGFVEIGTQNTYVGGAASSNQVIELENNAGNVSNLYTNVATVAGQVYHLAFDFAERSGSLSNSQIDVFWGGIKVATLNTDTTNWNHFELDLRATATGSTQLEFKAADNNSLGGVLDNIALQLLPNTGLANWATALPQPMGGLVDTDGSEILSYTIGNIPVGALLSDGTNNFTATAGNASVDVSGWNLAGLSLTPPLGFTGSITLQYTATATESANGSTASTSLPLTLNIIAANTAPVAVADSGSGNEDSVLTGNVLTNDGDANGDVLWVTGYSIAGLAGTFNTSATTTIAGVGSFQMLANGSYTFTPVADWSGTAPLITYTTADERGGFANATLALNVIPVADAPTLAPVSNIYVLNAGNTVITTGSQDVTFSAGTAGNYERGDGVSQGNLELELGVTAGYLDNRFDPTGPNINDPGFVDVIDGKLTQQHYSMGAGTTVTWNYTFANGEDLRSEVEGGFNDLVVVVVTDPLGGKASYLVDSSETKFPSLSFTGNYSFTATMDGAYTFQWLVLNGGDAYKDSWLSIGTPSFLVPGMASSYAAPIDLSAISVGLADRDGSEALSVNIAGVPAGAIFDSGAKNADGSWTFTQAELLGLHLLPAAGYNGTMNLVITATATELATGESASVSQNLNIEITSTTTTYTSSTQAAQTLTGTAANDLLRGYAGDDTVNAGDGNDMVYGGAGNDTINGQGGNDWLYGGVGNDRLDGGAGHDQLVGGAGNDTLIGGSGADTFRWEFGDKGTAGAPASDVINDFDLVANSDRLDLRDLLVGEAHGGTDVGNLGNYLHFEQSGANTVIQISTAGAFSGGYNAGAVDQRITLNNVDLTSLGSDQAIIQDLLTKGKLITD